MSGMFGFMGIAVYFIEINKTSDKSKRLNFAKGNKLDDWNFEVDN